MKELADASKAQRWILFIFIGILVFLAGSEIYSFRNAQQVYADSQAVAHTNQVLAAIEGTLANLTSAESSQRGRIVTGNEDYSANFDNYVDQANKDLVRFTDLTSDNPSQQRHAEALTKLLNDKVTEMRFALSLYDTQGKAASEARVRTNIGKHLMDSVRVKIAEALKEEERLLAIRQNEMKASSRNAAISFWATSAVGFILLAFLYRSFMRQYQEQIEARAKEAEHRSQLEERIKERDMAELARQRVLGELARSNRELQDFAFVASHDLQEPLRKIQAFGDRLSVRLSGELSAENKDYLDRMQNAANRMSTLIEDLLAYSRVTSKAKPYSRVDLNETLAEVIDDLETRIERTHAKVTVGKLPVITADELQMRQLFQNLIGNALKFQRPDFPPEVTITGDVKPDDKNNFVITVADNGIGFDQKYVDRIFTVFQRLHGRSQYEGSGIGLSICRKIVERHGGSIDAVSEPGNGAKFIVTLPLKPSNV